MRWLIILAAVAPGCFLSAPDPTCTNGRVSGDESASMRPGEACISCHQSSGEAPMYGFMGTVYPSLNQANRCAGSSGATVVVTDANGAELVMTTNGTGNFMGSPASFQMPFTAKILFEGRTAVMTLPQTSGDCNGCHTQAGANGAPGRIVLP